MLNSVALQRQRYLTVLVLVLAGGVALLVARGGYDMPGLLIAAAGAGFLAVLMVPRMARMEAGTFMLKVLAWGLLLKLGFAMVAMWFSFGAFGGRLGDAAGYNMRGTVIAQHIWRMEFDQVIPSLKWGTSFIDFLTGAMYSVLGPTRIGAYLIYACLAYLGSYFFYKAFRAAFPQGNRRLFAVLVFFFPSILLWSNGIGKDAPILLGIGLFAYGSAVVLSQNRLNGLFPLALGFLGTMWVRPHIAAVLALAFILSFMVPGFGKGGARPAIFIVGLVAVGVLAFFLLPRLMPYVGLQELTTEGALGLFEQEQNLTSRGGSAFQAIGALNPVTLPMSMIGLLFRPFPWEASNFLAIIQSLEGLMLAALALWQIKSLGRAVVFSISHPFPRFVLIYIFAFALAFSSVQNFGILARQRTMMLPFFFMLMTCIPSATHLDSGTPEAAAR